MVNRILSLVGVFVVVAFLVSTWKSDPIELVETENTVETSKKPRKNKGNTNRSPASQPGEAATVVKKVDRNIGLEQDQAFNDRESGTGPSSSGQPSGYSPLEEMGPLNRSVSSPTDPAVKRAADLAKQNQPRIFTNQGFPTTKPAPTVQTPKKSSGSSSTVSTPEPLSCSASIGAGTYSSPRSVTLTCSASAEIRYCLQENVCCDPSAGSVYTGAFTVGATVGDFCLSIQGENNDNALVSEIVQLNLQFNPDVPHLVVEHAKRYWQTGQLSAAMSFVSNNFGSPNLEAGILNLMTHDPTPSGLNMTCEQIVEDYTTLTTPAPLVVLPGMNVKALNPSVQLDAWLSATQLSYGINHVTTYIKNNNYGSESFACSTTKLVVEDFEFFTPEAPAMVDAASLDGALIGGFSTYGHFEEDAVLNRTPAGSMINNRQDQELRTGLIGIFF
jgi:hypothetical protein